MIYIIFILTILVFIFILFKLLRVIYALKLPLHKLESQLKKDIETINVNKAELSAILGSMKEGVMVIGKDERILLINKPVIKTLDVRTKDAVGKLHWEVIRNEEINSVLRETIRNRQPVNKEIHILSPADIFFSIQTSVIANDDGTVLGAVAVFHDITELKKIDKMRKDFTANVSHELKTPLTLIKGFAETLLGGAVNDREKAEEFLKIIKAHADRLEYLLSDLLTLSKIESKGIKMEESFIEIQDLVKRISALYKNRIDEKHLDLTVDIPEGIPFIHVDEIKMEQAFSNLLDNAVKFTHENGRIIIKAEDIGNFIRVDFIDTGIGISKEHLPRIFERFYTVDKARSRELGGTGLGLSIVKHIIEAHGGRATVESIPEKGSKFSVYLPH